MLQPQLAQTDASTKAEAGTVGAEEHADFDSWIRPEGWPVLARRATSLSTLRPLISPRQMQRASSCVLKPERGPAANSANLPRPP
jgi:hypothetical protein